MRHSWILWLCFLLSLTACAHNGPESDDKITPTPVAEVRPSSPQEGAIQSRGHRRSVAKIQPQQEQAVVKTSTKAQPPLPVLVPESRALDWKWAAAISLAFVLMMFLVAAQKNRNLVALKKSSEDRDANLRAS